MRGDVYRDDTVWVRDVPCDACLLSKDRLVPGRRARELIRATRGGDGTPFICHKHQVSDEPASICAAWWEQFAGEDPTLRLAMAWDVVARVATTGADR